MRIDSNDAGELVSGVFGRDGMGCPEINPLRLQTPAQLILSRLNTQPPDHQEIFYKFRLSYITIKVASSK